MNALPGDADMHIQVVVRARPPVSICTKELMVRTSLKVGIPVIILYLMMIKDQFQSFRTEMMQNILLLTKCFLRQQVKMSFSFTLHYM